MPDVLLFYSVTWEAKLGVVGREEGRVRRTFNTLLKVKFLLWICDNLQAMLFQTGKETAKKYSDEQGKNHEKHRDCGGYCGIWHTTQPYSCIWYMRIEVGKAVGCQLPSNLAIIAYIEEFWELQFNNIPLDKYTFFYSLITGTRSLVFSGYSRTSTPILPNHSVDWLELRGAEV